jgi:hypothetical protein
MTLIPFPYVVTAAVLGTLVWVTWRNLRADVDQLKPRERTRLNNFRAMGRTNYFELSGVPPPKPLPNFKIDEAMPRPYRPFRWKYHQTMCT